MTFLGERPIGADVRLLRVLLGRVGLAQPSGWLPFAVYQQLPYDISSATAYPYNGTISRPCTVQYWYQAVHVLTTNDGSNYWTITLHKAGGTQIASLNTSAMSPSAWDMLSTTGIAYDLAVADRTLYVYCAQTGSPGHLSLACPAVFVT